MLFLKTTFIFSEAISELVFTFPNYERLLFDLNICLRLPKSPAVSKFSHHSLFL